VDLKVSPVALAQTEPSLAGAAPARGHAPSPLSRARGTDETARRGASPDWTAVLIQT